MQTSIIPIKHLVSEAQCYETVRQLRWQEGVACPHCDSGEVIRRGFDGPQRHLRRYECKSCGRRFDDLTGTALSGHHQPLSAWVLCLYFMGLNLSNAQIAQGLDWTRTMCRPWRSACARGWPKKRPRDAVGRGRVRRGLRGGRAQGPARQGRPGRAQAAPPSAEGRARGRRTKATEKPPIFGMAQRSGEAVVRLPGNVRQETIKPLMLQAVAAGTLVNTDEYSIYSRLAEWGYGHKTVNHSQGEYARDEDGDGFHEVHVNTMEGLWSLLRSWLRPHRGLSQDKLPLYLAFFEFVYNLKRRGKRLLSSLLGALLKKTPKSI